MTDWRGLPLIVAVYADLDLGCLGRHPCLATGAVTIHEAGAERTLSVALDRVTVNIQTGENVAVVSVLRILEPAARTDLEIQIEQKFLEQERSYESE